jgi:dTDP-4-amino-4,6-dideoxygalactose transaminase
MSDSSKSLSVWPHWPVYADDEISASSRVLQTGRVNYWTGSEGRLFEQEFAEYVGLRHGIAVANGSVALGIALRALNLGPGAEVVVTPRTFIASVNEIILAGAVPVFADVDVDSQNVTAESVAAVISPRTAAILAVHLAGWPCDMPGLTDLANVRGIPIIEDCAQAHGASIAGRKAGSWGNIAVFSFCQDKIMSTGGEGGMIVTNSEDLWRFCWSFKDHGKVPELLQAPVSGKNTFQWVHGSVGTNARITEPQAAIGRIQLRKLDFWLQKRRANAAQLTARLTEFPGIRTAVPGDSIEHAYYKYYCFIRPDALNAGWSRDRILAELGSMGIPSGSGVCPEVYMEDAFVNRACRPTTRLPNARALGQTSIMLPVHPSLDADNMERIAEALGIVLLSAVD